MTLFQSIILGIVQGLTEFFPVSSSAHLGLAKWLLGLQGGEHLLYFDLVCHSGTLLALILFLRRDIAAALKSPKALLLMALALCPLVPAYFLMKPLRIAASDPAYLGFFLMFTALLLFFASIKKSENRDKVRASSLPKVASSTIFTQDSGERGKAGRSPVKIVEEATKVKDVLCIGLMQTLALLPGISRSGSTIATGRLLGWDWIAAARFSFLLATPAILGGLALETLKLLREPSAHVSSVSASCYAAGFIASFAMGMACVRFMFKIYELGIVRPFAWYCLAAGLLALWAFHA
jgi:undecaprenyl-diphosphatase